MMISQLVFPLVLSALVSLEQPEYPTINFIEPKIIRTTVYTDYGNGSKTADGSVPREGMVAGRKEDLGKLAILYRVDADGSIGEMIGIFEFTDTGSHKGLVDGTRVDVYRSSLKRCNEWVDEIGDYCYVQIIDAEG